MSAPISPSLPRSPQISGDRKDELFAFDGVDALWQSWRDGLTPDAQVSEWADRHRFLSPRASAEPGRYATSRTPASPRAIFRRRARISNSLRSLSPRMIFTAGPRAISTSESIRIKKTGEGITIQWL
jgi:hypothetical protein